MRTTEIKITCYADGKFDFLSDYESGHRCDWASTIGMFTDLLTRLRQELTPVDETEIQRLERRIAKLEEELRRIRLYWSSKHKTGKVVKDG